MLVDCRFLLVKSFWLHLKVCKYIPEPILQHIVGDVEDAQCGGASDSTYSSWSDDATKSLINLYREHEEQMENPRQKKREVWKLIQEKMNKSGHLFSQNKIECKWRNLMKSHKEVKDNKSKSGGRRKTFQYYEEIDDIVSKRHDINPPFTSGTGINTSTEKKKCYSRNFVSKKPECITVDDIFANCNSDDDSSPSNSGKVDSSPSNSEKEGPKVSTTPSAIRRREKRARNKIEHSDTLSVLKEMQELQKQQHLERENSKKLRNDEKNALLRELIDVLKK